MKVCKTFLAIAILIVVEAFGQRGIRLKDCGKSACVVLKSWPSFFETANGSVPTQGVKCLLKSNKIRNKCVMDISSILKTITTNRDIVLYFGALCSTPMHIVFNNSQNATKRNAIFYLQLQGHCSVSVEDITPWGTATDFRVFYMLQNTTLLEDKSSQMTNNSLQKLENIGTLMFYKPKSHKFPSIFRTSLWPRMAEVRFSNLQLTSVPAELKKTMPLLQSLEVAHNKLTTPPPFPWCNSTLQLPRGLSRTLIGNHHYQHGTIAYSKIYRRFFDLAFNNIEDRRFIDVRIPRISE